jgi:hypothetical protein
LAARRTSGLWITGDVPVNLEPRRAGVPRFGKPPGDPLMFLPSPGKPERHADVAQLVAHHLAKVRVAGSNPVVRSERPSQTRAGPARWSGREARQRPAKPSTRVQIPSPPRKRLYHLRAIGAAGARFLDTEEVTGSIPVSPTYLAVREGANRRMLSPVDQHLRSLGLHCHQVYWWPIQRRGRGGRPPSVAGASRHPTCGFGR